MLPTFFISIHTLMIFYFSGTGNTKWAASKTAAALNDQLIDIAATLKHADNDSTFSYELKDDEPVGFFFPVHGWRPPLIVKEFVRRLRINQAGSYCYVVCTAGDNVGEAVDILEKDLAEVGIKVHSAISLIMPESYVGLPFMDVDKPEKEAKKKREADEKLSKFIDDILHAIADEPNLCKHIHFPAQSGSTKILKLMNRKYTREQYLERVAAIRRIIPDCGLTTDLFVGYHDETPEDHAETLSLVRECMFDSAFMFKYSERPGTYAAKHLPDNVPEEVKIERLNELIRLQTEVSAEQYQKDVGKTFEVLYDEIHKLSI